MFFLHSAGLDDFVLSVFKAVMLVFGVSLFVVVHETAFLPPRQRPPVFYNKEYEGFQHC